MSAVRTDDGYSFTVTRAGRDSAKTTDPEEAAALLARLGVDDPMQLVEAAMEWRRVEIMEEE